jgi:hypothetical protein
LRKRRRTDFAEHEFVGGKVVAREAAMSAIMNGLPMTRIGV